MVGGGCGANLVANVDGGHTAVKQSEQRTHHKRYELVEKAKANDLQKLKDTKAKGDAYVKVS